MLILLLTVIIVGGMPLRAWAGRWQDGGGGLAVGNGRYNRNSVTIRSPEFNHGIQHLTNTNVGGGNNSQASFCLKRFRHCRISQHLNPGW
ncbi:hypothetical protein [Actinomadura sp. DC4]|uniref:hypothetical protein n=1 Tax=Actinomadura sp. DC4 TaxID=3055069 RepID=UPI0025B27252|nr:hypothetical protein [Actinomadura sp. DC4]MDN3351495.1 hypothetical protein [Actinomadura sp. DC4]